MRNPSRLTIILLLIALLVMTALLACGPAPPELPRVGSVHETLRARVEIHFEEVDMYKPRVPEGADLDPYLAPMIYREVAAGEPQGAPFGALVAGEGGWSVDASRPTVYYREGVAQVNGEEHEQLSFLWFAPSSSSEALETQGLRVTCDAAGSPAIFEVLADSSGIHTFYVTRPLETLGFEEHGAPLPGRVHALEPSLDERPDVLVPRTVGQSPVALGPMAYLRAVGGDVVNVHCRCDPSLISSIRATPEYELVPLERMPEGARDFEASEWPWLCLRLPGSF